MTATTEPLLIDAKQAARLLAISTRKLWTLTNCGEMPCIKIGRAVRYNVKTLERWVNRREGRG
jgi:excisionase family DNA binding protein